MSRRDYTNEYITAISSWEGADWAQMDGTLLQVPPPLVLEELRRYAKETKKNEVTIGHHRVHAFRTNTDQVWDVINGWR